MKKTGPSWTNNIIKNVTWHGLLNASSYFKYKEIFYKLFYYHDNIYIYIVSAYNLEKYTLIENFEMQDIQKSHALKSNKYSLLGLEHSNIQNIFNMIIN